MATQDIRIIEFIKWKKSAEQFGNFQKSSIFSAVTYYDEIRVHPVNADQQESLEAAYRKMEDISTQDTWKGHTFRQLMVGLVDISEDGISGHSQEEINTFWNDTCQPLFFVTMVNVSLQVDLKKEIQRIKNILKGLDYLLYLTYEYDEILIFVKSASFKAYAERVMTIKFHKKNQGVLDTVTVCCFNDSEDEITDENITFCIQLGVQNYQKAEKYLQENGIAKDSIDWVLGRNDLCFLTLHNRLPWVRKLCKQINTIDQREDFQWLTTTNFTIMIEQTDAKSLTKTFSGEPIKPYWCTSQESRIEQICYLYQDKCKDLHIQADIVFMRVLKETGQLVDNALKYRLPQDLAVCILPELNDFLIYLKAILTSDTLKEKHSELLREILNIFYLNVLSLVSSTVHSNQEFVQIPHSAPPSFEMPPKVIAYYGMVARQIIAAFQDINWFYGVMLAPKLVDDLEVQSFSITELKEQGQFISVNIGESFAYNMRDAVATLGHEMAHFVGEDTRQRELRKQEIFSCYIHKMLAMLCDVCIRLLPGNAESSMEDLIDGNTLTTLSKQLSCQVMNKEDTKENASEIKQELTKRPLLRTLFPDLQNLSGDILYDPICKEEILNQLINPLLTMPACQNILLRPLCGVMDTNDTKPMAYKTARIEAVFEQAIRYVQEYWPLTVDASKFSEYEGYLFSESYADIAMVLLFQMKLEDYIHVFSRGMGELNYRSQTPEDIIEVTRFIAVVRATKCTQKQWKTLSINDFDTSSNENTWKNFLYRTAKLVCIENTTSISLFCQKQQIDINLTTCLTEYLKACSKSLQEHFKGSQKSTVKVLRDLYRNLKQPRTILDQISDIRKQECDCLSKIIPLSNKVETGLDSIPSKP